MSKLYSYCAMFKLFVVKLKSKEVFGVNLVFNCRNRVGGNSQLEKINWINRQRVFLNL